MPDLPDSETTPFRILIDRDKCVGHGRCYSLAPAVYDPDDEGFAELTDGDTPATPELRAQARLGVETCPEGAISLISL
jgi:ferredoxin